MATGSRRSTWTRPAAARALRALVPVVARWDVLVAPRGIGVLTPPGLDEQWLVSLAHTQADMDALVGHFRELGEALRA